MEYVSIPIHYGYSNLCFVSFHEKRIVRLNRLRQQDVPTGFQLNVAVYTMYKVMRFQIGKNLF